MLNFFFIIKYFQFIAKTFFYKPQQAKRWMMRFVIVGDGGKARQGWSEKRKKNYEFSTFLIFFFLFSAPAILFSSLFGSCYPMYLSSHILNLNFMAKNENSFSSCSRDLFSSGFFLNSSQLNNDHSFSYKFSPDFPAELTKHWLQRKVHFHFVFFGG